MKWFRVPLNDRPREPLNFSPEGMLTKHDRELLEKTPIQFIAIRNWRGQWCLRAKEWYVGIITDNIGMVPKWQIRRTWRECSQQGWLWGQLVFGTEVTYRTLDDVRIAHAFKVLEGVGA